ncbi:hypothetical protein CCYA_CCYA02G0500 [Cyanidiococcus yangmingshanensis]|nr:hypothetical protein CCYA_CCYA02G0500 [Cyanidiococcus yangmingshanensis]
MIPLVRVGSVAALASHLRSRQRLLGFDFCERYVLVAASNRDWTIAAPFGLLERSEDGVPADAEVLNRALERARLDDDHAQLNVGGVVVNVANCDQDAGVGPIENPPTELCNYVEELVRHTDKLVDNEEERTRGLAILYWNQAHVLQTVREQVRDLEGVIRELELYPERERIRAEKEGPAEPEPLLRPSLIRRMLFGGTEGVPSRRLRKALYRKERKYPGTYHDPKREEREVFAASLREDSIAVHEILFDVLEELRRSLRQGSRPGTKSSPETDPNAMQSSHGSS